MVVIDSPYSDVLAARPSWMGPTLPQLGAGYADMSCKWLSS